MKLYPYQEEAVDLLTNNARYLLAYEMGLGKTAIAIKACERLLPVKQSCLVICPASLRFNWMSEIDRWSDMRSSLVEKWSDLRDVQIGVTSYERAVKLFNYGLNFCPFLVIFDEAHYLKNPKAKRTKQLLRAVGAARASWFLTGTPILNNAGDLWPILSHCSLGKVGNYWSFVQRYCNVYKSPWGNSFYGCKHVQELAELIQPWVNRQTVQNVLSDLPESSESVIQLEVENNVDLTEFTDDILDIIEGNSVPPERRAKASSAARIAGEAKIIPSAKHIAMLLESGEQVVVFAHHNAVVTGLHEMLPKSKIIIGNMPHDERQANVDAFQSGKLKCLIVSVMAGGTGITLTKSRIGVFVELPWSAAAYMQAKARLCRIGQKHFVNFYFLSTLSELDRRILRALETKGKTMQNFSDAMLTYSEVL